MPPNDVLTALLELVRAAAREGTTEALLTHEPKASTSTQPLVDKRVLAHALGVSTATVDRMCRDGRIPYVRVGDVRRFDLDAVRSVFRPEGHVPTRVETRAQDHEPAPNAVTVHGVRLLSRGTRQSLRRDPP